MVNALHFHKLYPGGNLMSLYWPILLSIAAEVLYQICAKSAPKSVNPFAALTVMYMIGAGASTILYFVLNRGGNIVSEWKQLNWATIILGFAIVGLEAGNLFMYKVGWNLNTGFIVKAGVVASALVIIGYLLFKEQITLSKVIGIVLCLVGLFFINR